jgi:hypothetical protein
MFRSRRRRGLDNIHRRRRRVSFRRSHWSPLVLEALPAQYRTALRRLERNSGRNATFRALRPRLGPRYARRRGSARRTRSLSASPALARLAALGIVLELLIQKEKLFTGSEDELTAAICTSQQPVHKFHTTSPIVRKLTSKHRRFAVTTIGPACVRYGPCRGETTSCLPAVRSSLRQAPGPADLGRKSAEAVSERPPPSSERRPSTVLSNRLNPVPYGSSCGSSCGQALLSHASSRRVSGKTNDALLP